MYKDTIASISTALGNGGIGIVRVSGKNAVSVVDRIFQSKSGKCLAEAKSHTIHYGFIYSDNNVQDENRKIVDEVLVSVMRAPKTYTAEDVVEINCHGGAFVTRKVLETVLNAGARAAEPGEFTKRAFLNGRIDLSEAEAVMDVIESQNEYALQNSVGQLRGSVKKLILNIREEILTQCAYIEAVLDDPEHMSFVNYRPELEEKTDGLIDQLERVLLSFENGRMLKEGIKTVILGKPNAGKSSLLNVLVGEERAIVTDIAGTTRDVLSETVVIGGISLFIMDTAGIRKSEDKVEQIGIERAKASAKEADLILFVADGSTALDESDMEILNLLQGKKAIILLNKSDLENVTTEEDIRKLCDYKLLSFSAKEETGLEELENVLKEMFFSGKLQFNNEVILTNVRQKEAISKAKYSLELVKKAIEEDMPEDFYTIDLMDAYTELGKVIGEALEDDLADQIFSKFCMGK